METRGQSWAQQPHTNKIEVSLRQCPAWKRGEWAAWRGSTYLNVDVRPDDVVLRREREPPAARRGGAERRVIVDDETAVPRGGAIAHAASPADTVESKRTRTPTLRRKSMMPHTLALVHSQAARRSTGPAGAWSSHKHWHRGAHQGVTGRLHR